MIVRWYMLASYLMCKFGLIVFPILGYATIITNDGPICDFMTYGNQLEQANHYLDLSDQHHPIDNDGYFARFYKCYSMHRHKGGPNCMNDANTAYFSTSRIWHPSSADSHPTVENHDNIAKRHSDCQYQANFLGSVMKYDFMEYHFDIHQHTCISRCDIPGGSTFMFAAFTHEQLLSCKYDDYSNNSYHVVCSQHQYHQHDESIRCMNLTILLDYEHYDAYSDGLPGLTSKQFKGYNELRYVILDNEIFCAQSITSVSPHNYTFAGNYDIILHDRVRVVTGDWHTSQSLKQSSMMTHYYYPNDTMFTAYDHRQATHQLTTIGSGNLSYDMSLPSTIRLPSARALSQQYAHFHPIIMQNSYTSTIISKLNLSPYDDTTMYHFIGASHMRYIYDAIIAHLLSEASLADLKAHHGFVTKYNLKNYHSNIDYATILSDDQADWILQLCSSFITSTYKKHTIIFQTGAWDLNNSPIRRFLKDKTTGMKLVKVIKDLISNHDICPKLSHFIWVTTVPHPICFNDDEPLCQQHKGYRTNAAISAQIQYYYQQAIFNTTIRDDLIVSVIDSYSIILPRLLLHTDTESMCLSHYHCRVRIDEDDPEKNRLVLAHTPSGIAIVHAVLTALSL